MQLLQENASQFIMKYNMNEIDQPLPLLLRMLRTAKKKMSKSKPNTILMVQKGKRKAKGQPRGKPKAKPKWHNAALRLKGAEAKD